MSGGKRAKTKIETVLKMREGREHGAYHTYHSPWSPPEQASSASLTAASICSGLGDEATKTRRAWFLGVTRACRATRGLTTKAVCILMIRVISLFVSAGGGGASGEMALMAGETLSDPVGAYSASSRPIPTCAIHGLQFHSFFVFAPVMLSCALIRPRVSTSAAGTEAMNRQVVLGRPLFTSTRPGRRGPVGNPSVPAAGRGVTRCEALPPTVVWDISEGLELPVQLIYLTTLLGFLSVGAYVVVQQVLSKRGMDEMAKDIGERSRNDEATPVDYYELGVILLRKKLFTQANQNLKKALKTWDPETGDSEVLAQVHNALGYSYFNLDRFEEAIKQYRTAVEMQPGYVTAWNNLGDVLEKQKKYSDALGAYQEVLGLDPSNNVAKERANWCRTRVERSQGML